MTEGVDLTDLELPEGWSISIRIGVMPKAVILVLLAPVLQGSLRRAITYELLQHSVLGQHLTFKHLLDEMVKRAKEEAIT